MFWKDVDGRDKPGDDALSYSNHSPRAAIMMRFCFLLITALALTSATGTRAAELEIPPLSKPKELSVYVNQANCMRWTDECVNCTRGLDGKGPTCSNIGFACQPKTIRCIGEIPKNEPDKK